MKNFILGGTFIICIGVLAFILYSQFNQTVVNPTDVVPNEQIVGGDEDEYGCKASAGYSWCEAKNMCLRIWEEGCPTPEDQELIRTALFTKNGWLENEGITVTVSTNDGMYAQGLVNEAGLGGGYFFAAKVDNEWKIVADGNGIITCSSLASYPDYPISLIPECYDEKTSEIIKR